MNPYTFLHYFIEAGAVTCAECTDRQCLTKEDPYCEKLQKAFRNISMMRKEEEGK